MVVLADATTVTSEESEYFVYREFSSLQFFIVNAGFAFCNDERCRFFIYINFSEDTEVR